MLTNKSTFHCQICHLCWTRLQKKYTDEFTHVNDHTLKVLSTDKDAGEYFVMFSFFATYERLTKYTSQNTVTSLMQEMKYT